MHFRSLENEILLAKSDFRSLDIGFQRTSEVYKKEKSAEPGDCQESADNLYALGIKPKFAERNGVHFQ